MDNKSLKQLLQRLNNHCVKALENAASFAASRGHFEVNSAHLLIKLLEDGDVGDVERVLAFFKVDVDRLWHSAIVYLNDQPAGCQGKPSFGKELFDWLQRAWLVNTLHYESDELRSVALIDALVEQSRHFGSIDIMDCLAPIEVNYLRENFLQICHGTVEAVQSKKRTTTANHTTATNSKLSSVNNNESTLEQFTQDLTAKAKSGGIDPVLDREPIT
jgi:type VI secretion system protein VasG